MNVSRRSVLHEIATGRLTGVIRVGNKYVVSDEAVRDFLRKRAVVPSHMGAMPVESAP